MDSCSTLIQVCKWKIYCSLTIIHYLSFISFSILFLCFYSYYFFKFRFKNFEPLLWKITLHFFKHSYENFHPEVLIRWRPDFEVNSTNLSTAIKKEQNQHFKFCYFLYFQISSLSSISYYIETIEKQFNKHMSGLKPIRFKRENKLGRFFLWSNHFMTKWPKTEVKLFNSQNVVYILYFSN